MDTIQFERKGRIGINPITLTEGQVKYLHILSERPEVYIKTNGEKIDFVMAIDMQSGEEGHFWLAGALRYHLEKLASERKTIKGLTIEVKSLGKKSVELPIEGKIKTTDVNHFDLYELK